MNDPEVRAKAIFNEKRYCRMSRPFCVEEQVLVFLEKNLASSQRSLLGIHEGKEVKQMECFYFNSIEISTYLGSIFLFRNSSYMKVKQSK